MQKPPLPRAAVSHHRPRRAPFRVVAVTAVLVLGACGDDAADTDAAIEAADDAVESADAVVDDLQDGQDGSDDLTAVLEENGLSSIATLLEGVDLGEITGGQPYTFFAPSDEAFLALDADTAADVLADPELVLDILRNHTVTEEIRSDVLLDRGSVLTVFGSSLDVDTSAEVPTIGGAPISATDIELADGVLHVVDRFLVP